MGLAGTKNRTKLSSDPNNNTWAKSQGFGHKILSSHGWKPGQYLGATNAAHASHYTKANASHIRVALRDDNLGLGATKPGSKAAETFGLLQLNGLLGRLNGKQTVEQEETSRRDAELQEYQGRKYGLVRFVSAGLLVGDRIVPASSAKAKIPVPVTSINVKAETLLESQSTGIDAKKSKKRKRGQDATEGTHGLDKVVEIAVAGANQPPTILQAAGPASITMPETSQGARIQDKGAKNARKEARQIRRQERAERKRIKAEAKAAKRARKSSADVSGLPQTEPAQVSDTSDSSSDEEDGDPLPAIPMSAVNAPRLSASSSRQAVRRRYIQQKRMAGMDPKAMNEILMIKS